LKCIQYSRDVFFYLVQIQPMHVRIQFPIQTN
jgi:hypothetical protein